MPKTYSQTYLYKSYQEYDRKIFEFIMKAERIDTSSSAFEDLDYDIKRRNTNDYLMKILHSDNVVLGINPGKALPKAFKVVVASDVKENKKKKVFIDVTDCVTIKNGNYTCSHIEWIIAYLINASTSYIYTMAENKLVGNIHIINDGAEAFSKCFSYIIDRLYKISTVQSLRQKVEYISALYYQINILGKDYSKSFEQIKVVAMKVSGISKKDAKIVDIMLSDTAFVNINTFATELNNIFKFKDLTVSIILDKWMQAFGTGTIFALEYFPAFSMMMTNTYVGGYIDQQLTIEKVTGQSMVKFTNEVLKIGSTVA